MIQFIYHKYGIKYFISVIQELKLHANKNAGLEYSFKSGAVIERLHDDGRQAKIQITNSIFEQFIVIQKFLKQKKYHPFTVPHTP